MSNEQQVVLTVIWTVVATLAGTWLFACIYSNFFGKRNTSSNSIRGDGIIATSTATASPAGQNYEVFLNFRGEDTRKTFTDHLYHRLVDVGVCVFRDNEELHAGEEIHPNLLRAIRSSKISIPIISPDYASSKWCLRELVQILRCRKTSDQIVIPIFYHVDPSDVRDQTGSFGKAFSKQKENNSSKVVQEWKEALEEVASLKVLELNNNADGYEGKLAKQVVEKVLIDLKKTNLAVPEYLVGVEEQAEKIMEIIDVKSSNDVQLVLIHGMSGIGKTTLAKFLYNQLSNHFQFCSFLENIHETPLQQLQKQLVSNILRKEWPQEIYHVDEGLGIIKSKFKGMKVLLVLDDVDHLDQLNALIGRYDYFGLGSIMIITSKNGEILNRFHVKLVYELKELDYDQSFQLFCNHAFRREDSHLDEFETVGRDIVSTTGGLPLAIVVIGSFLSGKGLSVWKETLKRLKRMPDDKVHLKLKLSYEALAYEQRQIFLDIACVLSSMEDLTSFMYMWNDCDYYPRHGIEVLKSLSLIKVGFGNWLSMHDQLKLLGREIVRQESPDLPERRKILWDQKEACEVMESNQGTQQIEVLNLAQDKRFGEICFTSEQFEKLRKLRLLQMKNANLVGNFKNCFLNLRWLQWYGCPSNFMATGFYPKNLVVLDLTFSKITENWGGWSEMKHAEKLKVLKLCGCFQLKATPDFSAFKELEILELRYCLSLSTIHPSICRLTKTLKTFDVSGCVELEVLPNEMGKMEELRELVIKETSIREVPIAEGFMKELKTLDATFCKKLSWLPNSIGSLTKLRHLCLQGCVSLKIIPESIGKLESLLWLHLRLTNIQELPNLHNLESICACFTHIKRLPAAVGMLKKLKHFYARGVHGLTMVPGEIGELSGLTGPRLEGAATSGSRNFPGGLRHLSFSSHSSSMEMLSNHPYVSNLHSLHLEDVFPEIASSLVWIPCPKQLSRLHLQNCSELMEIDGLEEAESLRELRIGGCRKISKLSGLGNSLTTLWLYSCDELKSLPNLSTLKSLRRFGVMMCNNIVEIEGLDTIECIEELEIRDCSSLERIGDLSRLTTLHELTFGNCPKLRDIDYPSIEKFTSLKKLCLIGSSNPMLKFLDLSKLTNLKDLDVSRFEGLREIPKLDELKSFECLDICGRHSLETLPDISNFKSLRVNIRLKLKESRGREMCGCYPELYNLGWPLKQLRKLESMMTLYKEGSGRWR